MGRAGRCGAVAVLQLALFAAVSPDGGRCALSARQDGAEILGVLSVKARNSPQRRTLAAAHKCREPTGSCQPGTATVWALWMARIQS